jgi:hypothetical protein
MYMRIFMRVVRMLSATLGQNDNDRKTRNIF